MTQAKNHNERLILVTGSQTSITLIQWLFHHQFLGGVIIQNDLSIVDPQLTIWLNSNGINTLVIKQEEIEQGFTDFLTNHKADLVLVFGFSWIIPQQLFKYVPFGFYNIHFSLLPAYKGPAPLFWQLKNGENQTGISIHRMSNRPDAGPVVLQVPIPIMEEEFMGFLHMRLSILTVNVVQIFLEQKAYLTEIPAPQLADIKSYQSRPTPEDLRINWQTMDAKSILALVKATNPVYGGAICMFREQVLRLVEVKQVRLNNNLTRIENIVGVISSVEVPAGIFVLCCCGESLEIKIVNTLSGTMSGELWKQLQQVKTNELLY